MDWNYIKQIVKTPRLCHRVLAGRNFFKFFPDKTAIKILWKNEFGRNLNLINPQSFNEKLQWLKLYYRKDIMTRLVDKAAVKEYVSNLISEKFIIPTICIGDSINEIDFDALPNKFVIKTTAGGGGNNVVIVRDKKNVNWQSIVEKFSNMSRETAFYPGREWPYKNVKNRIIVENLIGGGYLLDYKLFCFNGEPRFFKIDFDRYTNHYANYYSLNGDLLPFGEKSYPPLADKEITLPENFNEMISIARKLSSGFPFVRVDLYNVDGKIYFGELTFFPASGFGRFTDDKWDLKLGSYMDLPLKE
ncbi:MAG: hypothetical protein NC453_23775 [Muribaculum sp.]|nr:hypothetical protein [Muribaculum sp.]